MILHFPFVYLQNPYRMTIVTEGDNGPSYMIIVDRNKTLFWLKMLQPGNFIFEMSQILDFQPTAIASFGGCLLLGDTNSHTIWMSGRKLTEIKAHCLSVPSDVHIDHIVSCPTTTQQLVMVDTFNKRLTWITSEGDVTNRCSTGNINGLDTPSDVVYVDEDLLVCDATNNSVHVIDKDLNNSDILLKGPLEIWNPHRLAYCNINKQLYVATWDKYGEQPQLLTLTYNCKALK